MTPLLSACSPASKRIRRNNSVKKTEEFHLYLVRSNARHLHPSHIPSSCVSASCSARARAHIARGCAADLRRSQQRYTRADSFHFSRDFEHICSRIDSTDGIEDSSKGRRAIKLYERTDRVSVHVGHYPQQVKGDVYYVQKFGSKWKVVGKGGWIR